MVGLSKGGHEEKIAARLDAALEMETTTIALDGCRSTLSMLADGMEAEAGGTTLPWLAAQLERIVDDLDEARTAMTMALRSLAEPDDAGGRVLRFDGG
jgi:hypothetical protein